MCIGRGGCSGGVGAEEMEVCGEDRKLLDLVESTEVEEERIRVVLGVEGGAV